MSFLAGVLFGWLALKNKSEAINEINNTIRSSVDVVMQSTAGCNATVEGSNIISVIGSSNINISNIKQKVFVKLDASCTITQI